MKYPLTRLQWAARELICFTIGHDWKCSWRDKVNKEELEELDYDSLPYRDRQSGNSYCEYSAGWHYKCRRCRMKNRGDAYYPFWDYFKGVWFTLKMELKWIFREKEKFRIKLALFLTLPLELFFQFYYRFVEDHGFPMFPVDWALDLKWWIFEKLSNDE